MTDRRGRLVEHHMAKKIALAAGIVVLAIAAAWAGIQNGSLLGSQLF